MLLNSSFVSRRCPCGHPLRVGRRWTGRQFRTLIYDAGRPPSSNQRLEHCPACGHPVEAALLSVSVAFASAGASVRGRGASLMDPPSWLWA